jgi:hypothetical protein
LIFAVDTHSPRLVEVVVHTSSRGNDKVVSMNVVRGMGGVALESLPEILRFPTALPVAEGVAARHCSSLFFNARRTAGLLVGEKATH